MEHRSVVSTEPSARSGDKTDENEFVHFVHRIDSDSEDLYIQEAALQAVRGRVLFYPCSGDDLYIPLMLFADHVSEFWFVDILYGWIGVNQCNLPTHNISESLINSLPYSDLQYRLIRHISSGPLWLRQSEPQFGEPNSYRNCYLREPNQVIQPCLKSEYYRIAHQRRPIVINRRRGFGFTTLRSMIDSIGVFFYRGDSLGEGGSGNIWLGSEHMHDVIMKLCDGGLIVTDGSNHSYHGHRESTEYSSFAVYSETHHPPQSLPDSFSDSQGNSFNCVGYAGMRYGPTFVWQVAKASSDKDTAVRSLSPDNPPVTSQSDSTDTVYLEGEVPSRELLERRGHD
jgi:hypothetical protein